MSTIYTLQNEANIGALADADQLVVYDASTGRTKSCLLSDVRTYLTGPVTLTATASITAADHSGRTIIMSETGGNALATFTLPAATGTGNTYHFKVGVVNTSNYVIKVANATDTIDGAIISLQDAADTVVGWETAATSDTITLNGTTTGGVAIGDWVELTDLASGQFSVTGIVTSSGTEATPFSATVA